MLDKTKFEFSPLGKTFSTGLDKTAQGYQEEGIMKLLKDIRDCLAGGITPTALGGPREPRASRGPGLDSDDDDDDDNNMPDLETEEEAAKPNILNKFDEIVRNKEDEFDKMFKDKENKLNKLNNDVKKLKHYVEENKKC